MSASGVRRVFTTAGWVVVAAWSTALASCASPARPGRVVVVVGAAPEITISARGPIAARDVERVRRLLPRAQARLRRWGLEWRHPIAVTVHSDPSTFVRETGQTVPTLRAWSRWQQIDLLATDTWSEASDVDVERRLTHELCHLASWHRAASSDQARTLPRFVSEGVCSVVADQGGLRIDAVTVAEELDHGRTFDFHSDSTFAYAVAHQVVAGLITCRGEGAIVALLDDVYAGVPLSKALNEEPRALVRAAATGSCG